MNITYDQFKTVDLRVATVLAADRVEGSEKLIRMDLDLGEMGKRQIVSGIGKVYTPDELVGTQIVIVANLEPRSLMGLESHGMLLASGGQEGASLLRPERPVSAGSAVN
jgi:methionyl-tRNA synthetase